jgi:hypothetical protein
MRFSFVGSVMIVLALAGLAPSSAAAQNDTNGGYRYSKCICHFGYGGSRCVPAVSCADEGGRCVRSCGPSRQIK